MGESRRSQERRKSLCAELRAREHVRDLGERLRWSVGANLSIKQWFYMRSEAAWVETKSATRLLLLNAVAFWTKPPKSPFPPFFLLKVAMRS